MGQITIYVHKTFQDYADMIAKIRDTSRSEVIENCIQFVKDEELEKKVWDKETFDAIDDESEDEDKED